MTKAALRAEKRKTLRLSREQKEMEEQEKTDLFFMKEAMKQAKKALLISEVPIGCIIVKDNKIIARGYNKRNNDHSVLSHAEIIAIKKACKNQNDWRLEDCTMYITLEPCPMCSGAIVQARIPRVVIASRNKKSGCAGSVINLLNEKGFNHQCSVTYSVMEDECSTLLSGFFKSIRGNQS